MIEMILFAKFIPYGDDIDSDVWIFFWLFGRKNYGYSWNYSMEWKYIWIGK
jgi:hypothetical protein